MSILITCAGRFTGSPPIDDFVVPGCEFAISDSLVPGHRDDLLYVLDGLELVPGPVQIYEGSHRTVPGHELVPDHPDPSVSGPPCRLAGGR